MFEAGDYKEFLDPGAGVSAEEVAKKFMLLDYLVFNYSEFRVTDTALFKDKRVNDTDSWTMSLMQSAQWPVEFCWRYENGSIECDFTGLGGVSAGPGCKTHTALS